MCLAAPDAPAKTDDVCASGHLPYAVEPLAQDAPYYLKKAAGVGGLIAQPDDKPVAANGVGERQSRQCALARASLPVR